MTAKIIPKGIDIMAYENSISPGSTLRALASLRIVLNVGFCLPVSKRLIVSLPTSDFSARSAYYYIFPTFDKPPNLSRIQA